MAQVEKPWQKRKPDFSYNQVTLRIWVASKMVSDTALLKNGILSDVLTQNTQRTGHFELTITLLIMTRPFEIPFISSWSSIPHRPSSLNSSQLGLTDCYSIPSPIPLSKQWNPSISIWLCLHNASFKRSDESWDLGWFTKVL